MTRVVKIRGRLGPIRLEFDAEYEDPPAPALLPPPTDTAWLETEPSKPKVRRWQRTEVVFAWLLLVGSLAGWPLSALTWARDEPQFVLGLSWVALAFVALDYLKSARAHRDQER